MKAKIKKMWKKDFGVVQPMWEVIDDDKKTLCKCEEHDNAILIAKALNKFQEQQ